MRNMLLDESTDLHVLYSKGIIEDTVVKTIRNVETIGEKLHSENVVQRLAKATTAISQLLSKQHIPFFSRRGTESRSRSQLEITELKVNRDLMSRGCISCKSKAMNLDGLFMHENHPYTYILSDHGNLVWTKYLIHWLFLKISLYLCLIHQLEQSVTRSLTRQKRINGMRRFIRVDDNGWVPNEISDQDIPHKVGICNWQGQRLKPESSSMPFDDARKQCRHCMDCLENVS